MKKTHSLFLLVPLFLGCMVFMYLALTGCVRDVVLDAGEKPRVVVECVLTESSPQELRLSFTKGASLAAAPELTEAAARLIDLTNNYPVGEFRRRDDGIWALDYAAVPRHSYRLEVEVPEYDLVWAEQTMPERIDVETKVEYLFPPLWSSSIAIGWSVVAYRVLNADTPVWISGTLDYGSDKDARYVDRLCTDYPDVDAFNLTGDSYAPEIVYHVSDHAYTANYGSLYGRSLHRRFIRIPSVSSDQWFYVSGDFLVEYGQGDESGWPRGRQVCFSSFSQDYDIYLKQALLAAGNTSDLTSVFARDNLYSNIHGGIGIFGAGVLTTENWILGDQYVDSE